MDYMSVGQKVTQKIRILRHEPVALIEFGIIVCVLGLFVLYPVIRVITFASPAAYLSLWDNLRWRQAVYNSLFIVCLSTVSSTLLGFIFAYTITRNDLPGRSFFRWISILPIFSPPFAVAFSYLLMFGRLGLVTHTLFGLDTTIIGWHGLWLVQTISFFPFATLAIARIIEQIPPSMDVAARGLGAKEFEVFRTITWPLSRPGVASAALLVAIFSLTDFGSPLIIGGGFPLLATEAWYRIQGWGDLPGAAVVVTTLLPPALLFFVVERYWVSKKTYIATLGRGTPPPQPPTPLLLKIFLLTICSIISFLILLVYIGIIVGGLTRVWGYDWTFTLIHWGEALQRISSLYNSIMIALIGALLTSSFSLITGFVVARKRIVGERILDFLAVLPAAIPGVFIGIGYLLSFNTPPLILTGTPWIIIIALAFWNLPFSYQLAISRTAQIDPTLENAAANLGASSLRIFWDIYFPLLWRVFTSSFVVSFINCMSNLSIVVFLITPRYSMATFSILTLISDNRLGAAAALTTALLLTSFLVLGIASRFLEKGEFTFYGKGG